jgi:MFS family permease
VALIRVPAVLREEPQFRRLFLGQAFSLLGDRIAYIALPFAVLAAGGDVTAVGLVVAAQTIPFAGLSLAAGVWADRYDRRMIIIASDAVRLVCQVLAGALLIADVAEPWHLAAIAFVYGSADAFFMPAISGLMPQVVSTHNLQPANALRALTISMSMVAGPAIGGALVATVGAGYALWADALTFVISIAVLLRLRPRVVEREVEVEQRFLDGLRGGWREVRARSWVVAGLASLLAYHVIVLPAIFVLGPVLADKSLGGPEAWAVIVTAFGVGGVVGNLLLLRWRPSRPMLISLSFLLVASTQAAIIGSELPLAAIAGLEAVAGVAVAGYFTLWETSLQEQIPEHALSRVSSYDFLVSIGSLPLGTAIAGPVSEAIGLKTTMFGMTALGIAITLVCLSVPGVRALRRPSAPPAPA